MRPGSYPHTLTHTLCLLFVFWLCLCTLCLRLSICRWTFPLHVFVCVHLGDSPGNQIGKCVRKFQPHFNNTAVPAVRAPLQGGRFQPVCQVILHITNYTDSIIHCFPTGLTPWKTLVLYSQVIVLRIQISHCEENTLKVLKCKGACSIVLLIICSLRTNDLNSGCMAISLPTPMEMIALTDRLKKSTKREEQWAAASVHATIL